MDIDLNRALEDEDEDALQDEAEEHQAGHQFDLNMEPDDDEDAFQDEHQAGHQFDLNMDPDDELEQQHVEQQHADDEQQHADDQEQHADDEQHHADDQQGHAHNEQADKYKNLIDLQRSAIFQELLVRSVDWKLKKNTTREVANPLQVTEYKVRRVWRRMKECRRRAIPIDVRSRKPKNCGRKRIILDLSMVPNIPRSQRRTIRNLARALNVKKSTLHKMFTDGLLDRHSSSLKPYLRDANKKARLRFCISMLDEQSLQNNPTFKDMRNIIHLDEKWFNTFQKTMKFYKLPSEANPHRTVQNKNSIDKIMFLVLLARTRYNAEGICIFDGKIGIWLFIKKEPAPRRSDNRPRGTLITKTLKVNRDTSREFLIQKVLLAIQAVWPQELAGETIWIQQDNAPSHVPSDDLVFVNVVAQTGLDVRLMQQLANSPDMNILDLGLFSSLQSMTDRLVSNNLDELISNVEQEYHAYDADKINRVFVTQQSCLIEVMKEGEGNDVILLLISAYRSFVMLDLCNAGLLVK